MHVYGFDMPSFKLERSYLSIRKQRVKISYKFNSWEKIFPGVSRGYILGPLLFKFLLCDYDTDITNYADDNAPHASENATCKVIERLEERSGDVFAWFENNEMKANPEKCHLFVSKKNILQL